MTEIEQAAALFPLRETDGSPIVGEGFLRRTRIIAEAVFATERGAAPRERLDWLMLEVEDFVARGGRQIRLTLGLAAFAVSALAPLYSLRFASLGRMKLVDRVRCLERLEASALGAPVLAVKALLCVLYYEHPDAAREVGHEASCLHGPRRLLAPAEGEGGR